MLQLAITNLSYCVEKIPDLLYLVLVKMKHALMLIHIKSTVYSVFNYC